MEKRKFVTIFMSNDRSVSGYMDQSDIVEIGNRMDQSLRWGNNGFPMDSVAVVQLYAFDEGEECVEIRTAASRIEYVVSAESESVASIRPR